MKSTRQSAKRIKINFILFTARRHVKFLFFDFLVCCEVTYNRIPPFSIEINTWNSLCKCIIHQYLLIEFQVFISKENGGIRFEATSQQTKKSKKRNLTCLRTVNKIKLIIIDCSIPLLKAQEWIQKQFLYYLYWKACTVQKISCVQQADPSPC